MVRTLPSPTTATRALAGTESQSCGDKDEHAGWLSGGPPQNNPPFGCQSSPTATTTTTCTHPSNVATSPTPGHSHLCNGNNVSNDADGTLPTSDLSCRPADGPQAIYHCGQQIGPPSLYGAIYAPPAPPQGMMMYPSYAMYQQPSPF